MKVEIVSGCISCGACEAINSDIFFIDNVAHINEQNIAGHESDCKTAADACPVSVIKVME